MRTKLFLLIVFIINITAIAQTYWIQQTSPTSNSLNCVKAVDSNVVWACGDLGVVLRTINGGTDWTVTNSPNAEWDCPCIEAINADTAWVVSVKNNGGNTALYKTTDGGVTWTSKQSSNEDECFYNVVKFYDKDSGILYGDPENGYFAIYTTIDGGETWTRSDSSKIPAREGSSEYGVTNNLAISGNKAWFGTQNNGINARIFYSKDRGKTWSANPIENIYAITAIAFSSELNGIMIGDYDNIGYTRDGGVTWIFSNTFALDVRDISYVASSSFIAVGYKYYISNDGGANWTERATNMLVSLNAVSFANLSTGWAVGLLGKILKWTGGPISELPVSIKDEFDNNVPSKFEVMQNYPNPFNPSTKIKYSIPQQAFVVLKVYDLFGREVVTLVNEEKPLGIYQVTFNGSNLPSGVYFYQVKANDYVETKKMVLLQ
jgi:photosystem II stability/assembly factor-like uncharacterized protein